MDEMDEVVAEFLIESHENLDRLDRDLVDLEQNPSAWIAYENWGSELMRQRNYDAAIPLLRHALQGRTPHAGVPHDPRCRHVSSTTPVAGCRRR